jgi:serine/threonine-protein kinase HipA
MSTSIRYLRLYLHGPNPGRCAIGYLSQYGDILRVSFDAEYLNDPQRPTLSLSYTGADDSATRQILSATRDLRVARSDGRWPAYFQNLLPEGHNRERLARERKCDPDDEFELLAAAGHDLMGGVEVEPVPPREGIPDVVRHWHTALGLDVLEPGFVEFPVEDAAALPGVVSKFSAIRDGRRYVVRRHGAAGSFILKLPTIRHPDLVANEFAGYMLAGALGLDCAHAEIISRDQAELPEVVDYPEILAVRRFDRAEGGQRIHMEEFAQVLQYPPQQKYGKDMGNSDAHLKNWALLYRDGRQPELAPLYDPVCVTAFFDDAANGDYVVNRAIDARLRKFGWAELEALIKRAGLLRSSRLMQLARATVKQAQADWPALLQDAPANMRVAINERLAGGVALTRT